MVRPDTPAHRREGASLALAHDITGRACPWRGDIPTFRMPTPVDVTQAEIAFPEGPLASAPESYFASRLIAQVQREVHGERRHWLRATSRWLVAYDYVKELEDRLLMRGGDALQREKDFFASTIAILIGLGRLLHTRLRDAEISLDVLGLTLLDFAACVEELEDIDRAANRQPSPLVTTALRDLFHAPA